jgi:hypothetical protein
MPNPKAQLTLINARAAAAVLSGLSADIAVVS